MNEQLLKLMLLPKKYLVGICAAIGTFFGSLTPTMVAIITLYFVDFFTGITKGIIKKDVNSDSLKKGVLKGLIYLTIMIIGSAIAKVQDYEVFKIVTLFFANTLNLMVILTESISSLENLEEITLHYGLDLPVLRMIKKMLKKKSEEMEEGKKK